MSSRFKRGAYRLQYDPSGFVVAYTLEPTFRDYCKMFWYRTDRILNSMRGSRGILQALVEGHWIIVCRNGPRCLSCSVAGDKVSRCVPISGLQVAAEKVNHRTLAARPVLYLEKQLPLINPESAHTTRRNVNDSTRRQDEHVSPSGIGNSVAQLKRDLIDGSQGRVVDTRR